MSVVKKQSANGNSYNTSSRNGNSEKSTQNINFETFIGNLPSWTYDMWSLGIILLEIATGIPVWMSLKCRSLT